jgi:hypothetical protein
MKNDAYDRIIDRYLNGQMNRTEEEDFFRLIALDDELRTMFAAENLIKQTTRKDAETVGKAPAESYTNFLAALAVVGGAAATAGAASATAATSATATSATAATTASTAGGSFFGAMFAGGAIKAVIAAVGMAAIGTGVYMASPLSDTTTAPRKGAPAHERTINDVTIPTPTPLSSSEKASENIEQTAAASTTSRAPVEMLPESAKQRVVEETPVLRAPATDGNAGASASMKRSAEQSVPPVSPQTRASHKEQTATETSAWEQEAAGQPMRVIVSDSIKLKIDQP